MTIEETTVSTTDTPQTTSRATPTQHMERTHVGTEMSTGVISCAPGDTVLALARRMSIYHTHAVVIAGVWDDGSGDEELRWALISHEVVVQALADGRYDSEASELEVGKLVTCGPHDSMLAAARLMRSEQVDHLVVVDGDDPVGVISTLDLMRVASR